MVATNKLINHDAQLYAERSHITHTYKTLAYRSWLRYEGEKRNGSHTHTHRAFDMHFILHESVNDGFFIVFHFIHRR